MRRPFLATGVIRGAISLVRGEKQFTPSWEMFYAHSIRIRAKCFRSRLHCPFRLPIQRVHEGQRIEAAFRPAGDTTDDASDAAAPAPAPCRSEPRASCGDGRGSDGR